MTACADSCIMCSGTDEPCEFCNRMVRHALMSNCGQYRYELTRIWDPSRSVLTWCLLNPSTADAKIDDHTIR